jgi:hypothetical protein
MSEKSLITAEYLRSILDYDPETGIFTRLTDSKKGGYKAGDRIGSFKNRQYESIGIDMKQYASHRLAFMYMIGRWPIGVIDHIDRNKLNNSWNNLRESTYKQNGANSIAKVSKKLKGVSWNKKSKLYQSYICPDNKKIHLGYFDCPAAASFAYQISADIHFGEFARAF